jgi:hypothetical protein
MTANNDDRLTVTPSARGLPVVRNRRQFYGNGSPIASPSRHPCRPNSGAQGGLLAARRTAHTIN